MKVEVTDRAPAEVACELLAIPFAGRSEGLGELAGGRLSALAELPEAKADAGSVAVLHAGPGDGVEARRVALVGIGAGETTDADGLRTAAAAVARAGAAMGGTVAWAFDSRLGLPPEDQARAVVEGAVLGAYDPARWKSGASAGIERFLLVGFPAGADSVAAEAETVARWTNYARELVDAPPNELTPSGLADAARVSFAQFPIELEELDEKAIEEGGLGGLTAVGGGSTNPPRLIVARYGPGGNRRLALVGKGITFDSGGFFLKPQSDIVRQKADMGGAAAVLAATGAIAELGLPIDVLAVVPAAENMIGGAAFRPGDIVRTASGLTVEITNPDAEGRLVLADALWYAQREGADALVDLATLTGAMRAGMGDLYAGAFSNDDALRAQLVAAGEASGDYVWPWPLHPRYRRLLDSSLADLRNTSGRSFGYPILAAAFIERFVDGIPWAHVDIHSTAYLDEQRDYLGPGASGAGVRLLVELARRRS